MNIIILDGRELTDQETAHKYFKKIFDLSDTYGNNLDALWDMLTENDEKIIIRMLYKKTIEQNLGDYGKDIIQLFEDLSKECKNYSIEYPICQDELK